MGLSGKDKVTLQQRGDNILVNLLSIIQITGHLGGGLEGNRGLQLPRRTTGIKFPQLVAGRLSHDWRTEEVEAGWWCPPVCSVAWHWARWSWLQFWVCSSRLPIFSLNAYRGAVPFCALVVCLSIHHGCVQEWFLAEPESQGCCRWHTLAKANENCIFQVKGSLSLPAKHLIGLYTVALLSPTAYEIEPGFRSCIQMLESFGFLGFPSVSLGAWTVAHSFLGTCIRSAYLQNVIFGSVSWWHTWSILSVTSSALIPETLKPFPAIFLLLFSSQLVVVDLSISVFVPSRTIPGTKYKGCVLAQHKKSCCCITDEAKLTRQQLEWGWTIPGIWI